MIIIYLFHSLLLFTPFVFTWINEELFEFNKMLFVYTLTALILGAWLVKIFWQKKIIFRRSFFEWPILLFVASQVLSTIFSIHPRTSWLGYYTRFNGGLLSTLTYASLYFAFVSNVKKKQLKLILVTMVTAALLASLYAIPEHFGASPSCLLISNKFNVDCWVQDVQNRVFGTFGQPNWLAGYLITIIPVALTMFWSWPGLLVLLPMLFAVIFTKSRSGQLGLVAGLSSVIVTGFVMAVKQKQKPDWKKNLSWLPAVLLLILVVSQASQFVPKTTLSPATSSPTTAPVGTLDSGGTESGAIRLIVWQGALKVWQRYPLFGSGVETFAYSYYQDRPLAHNLVSEWDFLYNKAHNEFLNYLATTGAVGLLTYLIFLSSIGVYVWKKPTKLNRGLAAGILGMSVSNFFGFSTVMTNLLLFLFPAMMVVNTEPAAKSEPPSKLQTKLQTQLQTRAREPDFILQLLATGILIWIALSFVAKTWLADLRYAQGQSALHEGDYINGIHRLQQALILSPQEAMFADELSDIYARYSVALIDAGEATTGAQLAQAAIDSSDYALELNPRQLNFYKTRARIFITLAQLDPDLLTQAKESFQKAIELAPTDAKLRYNIGLVELGLGDQAAASASFQQAIEMKPDYAEAKRELDELTSPPSPSNQDEDYYDSTPDTP